MMFNDYTLYDKLYEIHRNSTVDFSRRIIVKFKHDFNKMEKMPFFFSKELESFCILNNIFYYIERTLL